jgi:hypothetical protein
MNFKDFLFFMETVEMGININDKIQDFTGQIMRGEKTIETRKTNSLKSYIGKRMGIIRTGRGRAYLVGYATIGNPKIYKNEKQFRKDYDKHRVEKGSPYDIEEGGVKWGYPLSNIEKLEVPREVSSRGIIARKL